MVIGTHSSLCGVRRNVLALGETDSQPHGDQNPSQFPWGRENCPDSGGSCLPATWILGHILISVGCGRTVLGWRQLPCSRTALSCPAEVGMGSEIHVAGRQLLCSWDSSPHPMEIRMGADHMAGMQLPHNWESSLCPMEIGTEPGCLG